jgi:ATP-binding cassette subfamily F protein 3
MSNMAAVTIQNVSKEFGPQIVLENVSLELQAGEVAGLVGANGSGKTTLFRMIVGEYPPDQGTITCARGVELGYLQQEPELDISRTLYDEVGSVFDDLLEMERRLHQMTDQMAARADDPDLHELMDRYERLNTRFIAAGGHTFETRMNEILGGLGFAPTQYALPLTVLSGGQKCRAALAKLLLRDSTFLLLDEPTNHLDIDAVRWLEKFLAGHHGGAVVISHDRYLLDRVCDRIIEVAHRRCASFPGNYSNYVQVKELRALTQQRQFEKDAEFIRKEKEFIAKHMAGQRTKEAQGRRKRLERRMQAGEFVTETVRHSQRTKLSFQAAREGEGFVVRADELSMAFGAHTLFSKMDFQVQAGQRFGITGPNGTGKTTLLRLIMGTLKPTGGVLELDTSLRLGYYAQEHEGLDPEHTILQELRASSSTLTEASARSLLAQYLFRGDDVFKKLGDLSGGEQSRVRLAGLILSSPDVLILDEPTNHLDIPSREALEEALLAFGGTIIVVSHDRYFLDRIVDHLLVIRPEEQRVYGGNYSTYIEGVEQARAAAREKSKKQFDGPGGAAAGKKTSAGGKGSSTRDGSVKGSSSKAASGADDALPPEMPRIDTSAYDAWPVDRIEASIIEHEERLAALHEQFGDPAVVADPEALEDLKIELEGVQAELTVLEAAWEERDQAV